MENEEQSTAEADAAPVVGQDEEQNQVAAAAEAADASTNVAAPADTGELKFDQECKIEKACSRESWRPPLTAPYFDGQRLFATDGKMIVSLAVEAEGAPIPPGWVPLEAIAAWRKERGWNSSLRFRNGVAVAASGATFPRPDLGEPIDFSRFKEDPEPAEGEAKITLNPKLLARFAEALGTPEALTLVLPAPDKDGVVAGAMFAKTAHGFGYAMTMRA